ncbi:hypothetical protein LJR143_000900 [Pseudoxanthomonas sp. LjRoot143]|uniref:hypothetical protein n=1 Tax=Pseudoxanthomonas sp. LjRoot143 TaxID=3342266 RepID=UPI003ED094FA
MQAIRSIALFSIACLLAACSGDNAEKAASGAVSKAVELAKGAATGASKGVEEGRKASTSIDGAVIVSSGDELKAALTGAVLAADKDEPARVTLGFANDGDAPVRVTELSQGNHVTGLDSEGYACSTVHVVDEFTVPAKAKLKVELGFQCTGKALATVRLYDVEYAVAR